MILLVGCQNTWEITRDFEQGFGGWCTALDDDGLMIHGTWTNISVSGNYIGCCCELDDGDGSVCLCSKNNLKKLFNKGKQGGVNNVQTKIPNKI